MTTAYVESSAFAKLVLDEPERQLLSAALGNAQTLVTSQLTHIEVGRAARRADLEPQSRAVLATAETIPIDRAIIERAIRVDPLVLRSLDAIHIATALMLGALDVVFYSYDQRTIEAAEANGLTVASPGA